MSIFLPPEVQAGLDNARKKAWRKTHRLRVQAGDEVYRVVKAWEDGFSLEASAAEHLRQAGSICMTGRGFCRNA